MTKEYKHITIKPYGPTGKKSHPTFTVVTNKDEVELGFIEYYRQWCKHIFAPTENTIYDAQCLRDITEFLETAK